MLPRISIVTPSLNQGQYLEKAIRSVLDQDYPDLEYFIFDGGSTDNSVEVIRQYEKHLTHWVSEPDTGQSHAINKGLRLASGDIVAYLNCDERYEPDAFRYVAQLFAASPPDSARQWISGAVGYEDAAGNLVKTWQPWQPPVDKARWVISPWGVPSLGTFWSRRLFDEVGLFREDMHFHFDTELGIRLLFAGYKPLIAEKRIGTYTRHAESKSVRSREAFLADTACFKQLFWHRLTWREKRRALLREGQYGFRDSIQSGHELDAIIVWLRTLWLSPLGAARLLVSAVRGRF